MSSPELKKYDELYNKLVSIVVEYHNRNQEFKVKMSEIKVQDLRRMLRELRKIEKEMGHLIWAVYAEGRAEARRLKQEAIEWKKLNPTPKGRPKKKENNNDNS